GAAGRPALLYRFVGGLWAQAYRTATGLATLSLRTTTVSPSIDASAQCHFRSSPAIAKPFGAAASFVISPAALVNLIRALSPSTAIDSNVGPANTTSGLPYV